MPAKGQRGFQGSLDFTSGKRLCSPRPKSFLGLMKEVSTKRVAHPDFVDAHVNAQVTIDSTTHVNTRAAAFCSYSNAVTLRFD